MRALKLSFLNQQKLIEAQLEKFDESKLKIKEDIDT
jgi:hypothetical protein